MAWQFNGVSLSDVLERRPGSVHAMRFDTSGVMHVVGSSAIPASDIVGIRDVWAVLARDLELGELSELACTDGDKLSLYLREWSGETMALVEGPANEDLGARADAVRALLEDAKSNP